MQVQLTHEEHGFKTPHISGPVQFKPVSFKGQLFQSSTGNPQRWRVSCSYVFAESKVVSRLLILLGAGIGTLNPHVVQESGVLVSARSSPLVHVEVRTA